MQGSGLSVAEEVVEIKKLLEKETNLRKVAEEEVKNLRSQLGQHPPLAVWVLPGLQSSFVPASSGFLQLPSM
jgi:hypothetical protein